MLDAAKQPLDQVAVAVDPGIESMLDFAGWVRGNYGAYATLAQRLPQVCGVERGIGNHGTAIDAAKQRMCVVDVAFLSRGQGKAGQLPQVLDQGMDLGAQPAARAPERLRAVFLGAPLACW